MALVKCNECGKEISSKAEKCPNCGAPVVSSVDAARKVGTSLVRIISMFIFLIFIAVGLLSANIIFYIISGIALLIAIFLK